ncbi:MAG: DUF192 domain-containing protein [Euryarchaeota archaeon]|nr:DUF192 domain-containing protein [Euryarchaeota archaeon]
MYLLQHNGSTVCRVRLADSFFSRLLGLMFRKRLPPGEGLLIKFPGYAKPGGVHSLFMRFALDLYYLDEELRVVEVARLKPWRLHIPRRRCSYVLEVSAGTLRLMPGDRLTLAPAPRGREA